MKLQTHRPLGSNMERCLSHAANGQSNARLSRSEIIKNVNANKKRAEIFDNFRAKFGAPIGKVANVKRTKSGFHVVGLGELPLSLGELKTKLVSTGNYKFRIGGLVFPLAKKN